MIVGVITESDLNKIVKTVASTQAVDVFEWRLDYMSSFDLGELKAIKQTMKKPVIFTVRHQNQGGRYTGSENQRLALLKQLCTLSPDYVDIEATVPSDFIAEIKERDPSIQIIRSYHNFEKTPEDIHSILKRMQDPHVFLYKIITYANNIFDNFSILRFVKDKSGAVNMVAHCMGPTGIISRVLGAVVGNYFHYAALDQCNAPIPHCPHVGTLVHTYGLHRINHRTKIVALLGDPVEQSVGHIFHNKYFLSTQKNAVYIKIPLKKQELKAFFKVIGSFPFHGFSITMPLKEAVIPYLTGIDAEATTIGAVNTVFFRDGQWQGTNTDGIGALLAIKGIMGELTKKHVLIIGSGGAAKAIAHACANEGIASLTILNRTLDRARTLANQWRAQAYDYASFNQRQTCPPFDVVVNAIPNATADGIKIHDAVCSHITPHTVVMDIDYGHPPSMLVEKAMAIGCRVVAPLAMYEAQALEQIRHWFNRDCKHAP